MTLAIQPHSPVINLIMLRKLLIPGILSGLIAAVLLTIVQQNYVVPLILQAETYETQSSEQSHSNHSHNDTQEEQQEWAPENGTERTFFTLMTNTLLGIGFSLLIITLMTATEYSGWQSGLVWGLAGFCVFCLAPGLGLPPELPGAVQVELEHRQLWWAATVISTAIGLSLLFLNPAFTFRIVGILFIIAPHFFISTITIETISPVPKDLSNSFIIASSVANILFWSAIGTLNGILKLRYFESKPLQKVLS